MNNVYLIDGKRTPQASFLGQLADFSAPELASFVLKKLVEENNLPINEIDEVILGQVVQAGCGQAPARQALIFAQFPDSIPATTINKVCGSGLRAIISGAQAIKAQDAKLIIAGGMESMSNTPHLLPKSRWGQKFGDSTLKDSLLLDGLWDVYSGRAMGLCAEECVRKFEFTREQQDQYAIESFTRAQMAIKNGIFQTEIVPIEIKKSKGESTFITQDEAPFKANFEKIPQLKPSFDKLGTITAANASTLNDGASALLMAGEDYRQQAKFRIVSYATHAQHPTWFTTAPIEAMKKAVSKAQLSFDKIGLFEINEAFAVVAMSTIKELNLNPKRVNIYGGAVALGHPLGSSGSRIVITLMNAMMRENVQYGMASLCIGGGEANAIIIEKL